MAVPSALSEYSIHYIEHVFCMAWIATGVAEDDANAVRYVAATSRILATSLGNKIKLKATYIGMLANPNYSSSGSFLWLFIISVAFALILLFWYYNNHAWDDVGSLT